MHLCLEQSQFSLQTKSLCPKVFLCYESVVPFTYMVFCGSSRVGCCLQSERVDFILDISTFFLQEHDGKKPLVFSRVALILFCMLIFPNLLSEGLPIDDKTPESSE